MVSTGDRGQPKLSASIFCVGRRARASSVALTRRVPAVETGLALNPKFTISRARTVWTAQAVDATYLAQLVPIYEGMRKAGVPEQ